MQYIHLKGGEISFSVTARFLLSSAGFISPQTKRWLARVIFVIGFLFLHVVEQENVEENRRKLRIPRPSRL